VDDRLALLESRVESLSRSLAEVEHRLAAVERAPAVAPVIRGGELGDYLTATAARPAAGEEQAPDFIGHLALVGRTLMVLAGAFLLRALTDGGHVPRAGGVALGLAYALLWLLLGDRAAARGRGASAAYHAGTAAIIADPLLWEAASRFGVLSASASAGLLALFTAGGLFVARRRRLTAVAWLATLGAIAAGWASMISLPEMVPGVALLIALGVATLWLCYGGCRWPGLRWIAAGAADLAVLILGVKVAMGRADLAPGWALAAQLALVVAFVGSIAARSLRPGWRLGAFAAVQTIAVLAVGYGGAVRAANGGAATALGLASLLVAGALSAVAFPLLGKRGEWRHTFLYFPSLAFVFLLGGTSLLLPPAGRAVAWAALALVAAVMATRFASATLGLFATLYAGAGAVASGLLSHATHGLLAAADAPWPRLDPMDLLVLAAIAVACGLRLPRDSAFWGRAAALPKLLLLALLTWTAGGAAVAAATPLLTGGAPGAGADPALLAALRTAVLAAAALLLAWAARWERLREAAWLVYPALAVGGAKLLWEDLRLGRPAELFVALALYGAALIFAPRLARKRS
jgi:hypothetical protein